MDRITRYIISLFTALAVSVAALAANAGPEAAGETVPASQSGTDGPQVDIKSMLFGHIGDSYQWHITKIGEKHIVIPLPVIVYSKSTGWHCFMSSKLEEGSLSSYTARVRDGTVSCHRNWKKDLMKGCIAPKAENMTER